MEEDKCIVVDADDRSLRPASKAECHKWESIGEETSMAHRAFSVFLFDQDGALLLQKRASTKITFPGYWANTCCSHPLWTDGEREEKDHLGVKRAARRKLEQELGIKGFPIDRLYWVARVHYRAPCGDDVWGEHEVDHVLLAIPEKPVELDLNPDEVERVTWVADEAELAEWVKSEKDGPASPWFELIRRELLPSWWAAVRDIRAKKKDDGAIRAALSTVARREIVRGGLVGT